MSAPKDVTNFFDNGVVVTTSWQARVGRFRVRAVWHGRVLNEFTRYGEKAARAAHELLASTWGIASDGNLRDEAQDAPRVSASGE